MADKWSTKDQRMYEHSVLLGEAFPHKVSAIYDSKQSADQAVRSMVHSADIPLEQIRVVQPGDPDMARKLEPETTGIAWTLAKSHVVFGLGGLVLGLLVAAVLATSGPAITRSSPVMTFIALGFLFPVLDLLLAGAMPDPRARGLAAKTVAGGLLVQSRDNGVVDDCELKVVTKRAPTDAEMADLLFAFRVAKHVKSNAIVYARGGATVGIGAGQMSRVDSARIAARKALDATEAAGLSEPLTAECVVASDAFFPFADGLLSAVEAGARAVIQPGGSMRDDEVIAAADEHGIAMVTTGMRHFRH